jgi:hypothetical protein
MRSRMLCFLLICLCSCGKKKIDLSGEIALKPKEFLSAFPLIQGNFQASDSNFIKLGDTSKIGLKAILQFVPDSAVNNFIGKDTKAVFYPVGQLLKEKETYLLVNIKLKHKWLMALLVLDTKTNAFLASKLLLDNSVQDEYVHAVSVNREPTFLLGSEKPGKDNITLFTRIGWVYTSDLGFMVVINDSNEPSSKTEIINPIDTLPRKYKYSADYAQDKKNLISIRDGNKPGFYEFFIHFEKNDGACIGELKGIFTMIGANNAQYRFNGDPCVIDFSFEDKQVSLKEQGNCGNHRGIKCYFNDSFTRKKEPKHKSVKR